MGPTMGPVISCKLIWPVAMVIMIHGTSLINGESSIFNTGGTSTTNQLPNFRPSLVPVVTVQSSSEPAVTPTTRIQEPKTRAKSGTPGTSAKPRPTAPGTPAKPATSEPPARFITPSFSPPPGFSTNRIDLEPEPEPKTPPGTQPVVSDANSFLNALRSSDASSCFSPFPRQFFSLPQRQESVTTGSIEAQGFLFGQDFRAVCYDRAFRKYRTIDGTCNHPNNYGASFTPVTRLLPAEYDDGIALPRATDMRGKALPSPRLVSLRAHPARNEIQECTLMVMQWGQWLDHDMTGFPVATEFDKSIKCCGENAGCPPFNKDKNCFPIELPSNEKNFEGQCMEFVRSISARDYRGNEIVPREQVNSLTSFIDGSQIYGSTPDRLHYLRQPNSCLLRSERGGAFLPASVEEDECMRRKNTSDYCFLSGDIRVNEQPGLGSMHTMFFREHNRIARYLKLYSRHLDDEEIFEKTRKIIGALQQVITYNEWLPIILGKTVDRMNLLSKCGRSTYNPALDPRIINVFSTAAMRFGHSLIPTALPIGHRRVPLRQLFNRPAEVLDNFDDIMAGLVGVSCSTCTGGKDTDKLQKVDGNFVREITNFLFEPPDKKGRGFDLVALNIQRGRDHGIPPYTKWRAFCGLRPLYGFGDTAALGPRSRELADIYNSVDDIDLFTGMMYEPVNHHIGGIVGPTLNCLLSIQFFNVKFGDRFFFDNNVDYIRFNKAQLAALRNMTLSKIVCQNTRVTSVPQNAFKFASKSNPLRRCRDLIRESLDLTLFL